MFSRLKSFWMLLAGSVIAVTGLAAIMLWKIAPDRPEPLILQCAAALREPIEEIVPLYEQETGQRIEVRFGESQSILTNLELSKQGDIFLPADESYISDAQAKGLLAEVFPLARMNAALAVNPAFGKSITSWDDLLQKSHTIAVANPKAAAISRLTVAHLGEAKWRQLHERCVEMGPVTHVANAIKNDRNIDAGIIWDSMVASPHYNMLRIVKLPELEGITATVKIGVVKNSSRHAEALAFTQFIAGSCSSILKKHGFTVIGNPPIAAPKVESASVEKPEILVYAGAMLRPAIEKTIKEFEKREGVVVNTVYNGCGILVSQMQTGAQPDLYFACDPTFMNQVAERFEKPTTISKNQLVIAVKKGNPHDIKSLKDLGQEGLRVGVGHEQKCALGAITKGVMILGKTFKAVQANIVVREASGDMLVTALRAGSLDAVVVYVSNVKPYDDIEAIRVDEVNCAPTQPIAIGRSTANPEVAQRLVQAIESAESRERFEKLGFGWERAP